MNVNISRSKLLINKKRYTPRVAPKMSRRPSKCNHCGGIIRENEGMKSCLMCSRDVSHNCSSCGYATAEVQV